MESFLDMTLDRNLYIGVPVGAFLCSLFLLFCFFNTMKSRTVRSLRAVLTSCLVWTGGVILMRLQVFPGIRFWHNFALFGLLVIPVFMYAFLFGFLEITEHDALIYIYGVLTTALVLGNAWSGAILPFQTRLIQGICTIGIGRDKRRQNLDTALPPRQIPVFPRSQMIHQGLIIKMGYDVNIADTRIDHIRQRKIDQTVAAPKRNRGHGAIVGQFA